MLVRDDGSALFDSLLVIEYLDHTLPEARRLIPAAGEPRWDVLRWQALAHGLIEATQARLLDVRRPEAQRSREVQAREEVRIARTLDAVDKDVAGREWLCLDRLTLADVVLGVALQYIDFRYPHDWRGTRARAGEMGRAHHLPPELRHHPAAGLHAGGVTRCVFARRSAAADRARPAASRAMSAHSPV